MKANLKLVQDSKKSGAGLYAATSTASLAYRHEVYDGALFWSWFWQLNSARATTVACLAAAATRAAGQR